MLRRCRACGLIQRAVGTDIERRTSLFDIGYFRGAEPDGYDDYHAEEPVLRRQARRYLRTIERLLDGKGAILDVGCAAGFLLDEARRRGWETRGCEPNRVLADEARSRGLGTVHAQLFDLGPAIPRAPRGEQCVSFLNVLEHCAQPRTAIARARDLLAPGGLLFIETWDRTALVARLAAARWHQWSPQRVTAWFDRRSLEALLPEAQWQWLHYGPVTRWISLRRGAEVVGLPIPQAVGQLHLPYRLGDLVTLIARRR